MLDDVMHDVVLSSGLLTLVLLPMLVLHKAGRVDSKAVSYAMSLACSLAMTAAGACNGIPTFLARDLDVPAMLTNTRYESFVCTFFGTFCCLDLVFGLLFYPRHLPLLTAWVHHAAYVWLMVFFHQHRICGVFGLFLFEELPTFLMALGNIHKPWRTNMLFGATFFFTRLVWHGILLWLFWQTRALVAQHLWPIVLATFALHVHWFHGFARQQLRSRRKPSDGARKPQGKID